MATSARLYRWLLAIVVFGVLLFWAWNLLSGYSLIDKFTLEVPAAYSGRLAIRPVANGRSFKRTGFRTALIRFDAHGNAEVPGLEMFENWASYECRRRGGREIPFEGALPLPADEVGCYSLGSYVSDIGGKSTHELRFFVGTKAAAERERSQFP